MKGEALKGHLDLLLLAVLERGAAHGYAVIEELKTSSDEAFDLPEGTVYPALHRLERDGCVTSRWDRQSGRRRRVYELTRRGRAELASRRTDWAGFTGAVGKVLGDPA